MRTQIAMRKRDKKLGEATQSQLNEQIGGDMKTRVWQGVGKMFMATDAGSYAKSIEAEGKSVDEQISALEKKQNYLETTLKNLTDALNEVVKRAEAK